ncbi:hypothetical protein QTG54_007049 [Skeletonema marinoi]|uniref:Uncharacterized protein n=1 Tax=Skeletonema marinoi TaxID=267567 RepID=A0AAD8XZ15_9STRA|nr:hypothetical protein QTG54_013223 [Skeletonema marinoi]KAK1742484.1 hypothetical protein QTG54_007049 [Skeletonema marinoi]
MATQIERDGARKMSGEDAMMFQDHVHPFVDKDDSPKSTPASSPAKMSTPGKKVLRPIEMPKPFKI